MSSRGTRRFSRAAPATATALGCLQLVLAAASWPLARLAHQSLSTSGGGPPIWLFGPFGVVGFVVGLLSIGRRDRRTGYGEA